MSRQYVDFVPVGYYLLVFVQQEKSRRPELTLPFSINDQRTVYQLADMYFEELQRVQGFPAQQTDTISVVLSKRRMQWSEQIFHRGDNHMKVRHWINSNLNGQRTIYVYTQESHKEFYNVGQRTQSIWQDESYQDCKKTRECLQIAIYLPSEQHKVSIISANANTVAEYIETALRVIKIQKDIRQFDVSLKFRGITKPIQLQGYLHYVPQGGQDKLIGMHSAIQIRPKRGTISVPQPFHLNFHSKDRYFEKFSLEYHTHKQFRCVNLCKMAGFLFPTSMAIRAKSLQQTTDRYLTDKELLSSWQDMIEGLRRKGENHLDCYFLNEHEYYYSLLQRDEGVLLSVTDLQDLLMATANANQAIEQTNSHTSVLESRMNNEDAVHKYLPAVVKCPSYFSLITVYTTNVVYSSINKDLRSFPPAITQKLGSLKISQALSSKISYLPLCDNSRVYYRGTRIREQHKRGEVIFYRQILSSSANINVAIGFMGADRRNGTLATIQSFSSRLIDPFSILYPLRPEQEYLHPSYTPFLVIEAQQLHQHYHLKIQELPLIRNYDHNHLVWLGDDLNFIIHFYNQLRYIPNKRDLNEHYLKIDLLPFKGDNRLELWLKEFKEIDVREDRAICIFTLPEDEEKKLARIKLIQEKIRAKAYICYGDTKPIQFNSRCQDLYITYQFIKKIQYTNSELYLKYCIINQKGFDLQVCPCCHSYCQIM